jgi:hypothetical protein
MKDLAIFRLGDCNGVYFFEYFLPSFHGMPAHQQNMFAEFVQEGFLVDMHISKPGYDPKEHVLFEEIIKSVKFEKKQGAEIRMTEAEDVSLQMAAGASMRWIALMDDGKYEECWKQVEDAVL